jgi:hypothetical protein
MYDSSGNAIMSYEFILTGVHENSVHNYFSRMSLEILKELEEIYGSGKVSPISLKISRELDEDDFVHKAISQFKINLQDQEILENMEKKLLDSLKNLNS